MVVIPLAIPEEASVESQLTIESKVAITKESIKDSRILNVKDSLIFGTNLKDFENSI